MTVPTTLPALTPDDLVMGPADWVRWAAPGLIWGSSFYLIAEGLETFSPYLVSWLRIGCGMCVILAAGGARGSVDRAAWTRIVLLSVVWMALPLTLFSLAEERVSSSVTGMLNGANPIFTAAVAAAIVHALPPARQLTGLAVGLAGIVLIAAPTWSEGSSSAGGIVMILAALACYGVALNVAGPLQRRVGSLAVIGRALPLAFLWTAPMGIVGLGDSSFSWGSFLAVAALGALGTGVAFVMMASNAGRYGSTRASSTTYLIPAVSIVLGVALRDETTEAIALLGSAVAVAGAYLVNTARRARTGLQ
ncbi:MAG: DMT family transporter [Ilumatobacter sp.]|nr:DMT family transporter [Ilumatobacter sp.]